MERFRVSFGDEVHTIGVSEPGVISVNVCTVIRDPEAAKNAPGSGCDLSLGGLDSSRFRFLDWGRYHLEAGDRILIEVLPEGPFDSPEHDDTAPEIPNCAAGKPARNIKEKLRETVTVLGWSLIEQAPSTGTQPPSAHLLPFESSLPRPEIDPSSTNGFDRFRVRVRDEIHTIGVPGPGVFSVTLHAVARHFPDAEPEHECSMELGGLYAKDIDLRWAKYDLQVGDRVEIEILGEGPFDPPVRTRTNAHIAEEYTENQRAWARKTAWDLGWTLIENNPDPLSLSN